MKLKVTSSSEETVIKVKKCYVPSKYMDSPKYRIFPKYPIINEHGYTHSFIEEIQKDDLKAWRNQVNDLPQENIQMPKWTERMHCIFTQQIIKECSNFVRP